MLFLPLEHPASSTGQQFSTVDLLREGDTSPLVLVPIVTAFAGLSALLVAAQWVGGGRRWARFMDKVHLCLIFLFGRQIR